MAKDEGEHLQKAIRRLYSAVAKEGCGCGPGCCGAAGASAEPGEPVELERYSRRLGYSREQLAASPDGANMGLGCGNPQAFAEIAPGEVVVDLGSGGGFDCFVAAPLVGGNGLVIGVDMTPEMIEKARANARRGGFANVEFRLGEIENLPIADALADVVISNCVVNLSLDKPRVLREMFRVLRPGGRVAISDILAVKPLPDSVLKDPELHANCVSGASLVQDFEAMLDRAGFVDVRVEPKEGSAEVIGSWYPGRELEKYLVSANVRARKP